MPGARRPAHPGAGLISSRRCVPPRAGRGRSRGDCGAAGGRRASGALARTHCASAPFTQPVRIVPGRPASRAAPAAAPPRRAGRPPAHRSTSTGTVARSATAVKSSSPASTIHGRPWWQFPQRGVPSAAAGTRLRFPQCGQVTMVERAMPVSMSGVIPAPPPPPPVPCAPGVVVDDKLAVPDVDDGPSTRPRPRPRRAPGDPGLDLAGDESAQRPGAVNRVVALARESPLTSRSMRRSASRTRNSASTRSRASGLSRPASVTPSIRYCDPMSCRPARWTAPARGPTAGPGP